MGYGLDRCTVWVISVEQASAFKTDLGFRFKDLCFWTNLSTFSLNTGHFVGFVN